MNERQKGYLILPKVYPCNVSIFSTEFLFLVLFFLSFLEFPLSRSTFIFSIFYHRFSPEFSGNIGNV